MQYTATTLAVRRVFLAAALAALVLWATAPPAQCADEEFVIRGFVFQSERGLMMETETGEIFGLTGLDMSPFVDGVVTVVGTLPETNGGEDVLHVSYALPDDETKTEDQVPGEQKQAQ